MKSEFDRRIALALADQELRKNFKGAMHFLRDKRLQAIGDPQIWENMRTEGARIRENVLNHLPELLEQLEANCQKNGIQVHWARDGDEANHIILSIAQKHQVRQVVKGKSMATEEIELNAFLAEAGIECLESDMGEYIVQLADEKPSHIIMPAIHKNKQQIHELFVNKLNAQGDPNDVDRLIGVGRSILRDKFRQADMGISGVNFAAADSGTLCLVENEGNGRMSTTAPPIHVAVMGLEKVIPSLNTLSTLLPLLTRSATGQAITTYINMISGPRKPGERDGPTEVHLVLLDNGRSAIHQDNDMQSTLACIRCGACMNHCPVYTRIGGHAYGSTYPGPIGQVITPQLKGLEQNAALVSACSLNGACGEACPVKIELPSLIRRLRERVAKTNPQNSLSERWLWSIWRWLNIHPRIYHWLTRCASWLHWIPVAGPKSWRKERDFPQLAANPLRHRMRIRKQQTKKAGPDD